MIFKAMEWTVIATLAVAVVVVLALCFVMTWREMGWWSVPLWWIGLSYAIAFSGGTESR